MFDDNDIKIVGDYPSREIKIQNEKTIPSPNFSKESMKIGEKIGQEVGAVFILAAKEQGIGSEGENEDFIMQRQTLLAFAALSSFERCCKDEGMLTAAKNGFYKKIKGEAMEFYDGASDNGALSFYYLAYRRGGEVERAIGQTFAMLCSHDGDPIYQELGEALYCWFLSAASKEADKILN